MLWHGRGLGSLCENNAINTEVNIGNIIDDWNVTNKKPWGGGSKGIHLGFGKGLELLGLNRFGGWGVRTKSPEEVVDIDQNHFRTDFLKPQHCFQIDIQIKS